MSDYEKPDFWSNKARKEGYPARSVYKLEEIDEKFHLFRKGLKILDIGAAPGSWSLWALKKLGGTGFLAAVDIQQILITPSFDNYVFLHGDMFSEEIRKKIFELGPYNIVMSDAAPFTSGNRSIDIARSEAIVETVLEYAKTVLSPDGSLVAKLFVGGGERALIDALKINFKAARAFKPKSCRPGSFETYLIGTGFKN